MKHGIYTINIVFAILLMITATLTNAKNNQEDLLSNDISSNINDAWLKGKVESAFMFNKYLSSFSIDTNVENGYVTLSGKVNSMIEKDLAEEVAKGIEGVNGVKNTLQVDNKHKGVNENNNKYLKYWNDATTTAAIKSKLIFNENVSGFDVSVSTKDNIVTLEGAVETGIERDLIIRLAENVEGVEKVINKIKVQ